MEEMKKKIVIVEDERDILQLLNFDEEIVTLVTDLGILVVKGSDLHLNRFSLDNTEISIEGQINSLQYNDKASNNKNSESLFTKIFK